jgi:chemotaxis protein methyltransferase CheR
MTLLQGDFDFIRDLVFRRTSIVLEPGKEYLAVTRLEPIRRSLGMRSLTELVVALRADPKSPLLDQVAEAMTTNETSFFRDTHPFDSLRTNVIPDLIERNKGLRTLRIWSAGCATGQEPYSIAMMLREDFPALLDLERQILATDVSATVLAQAREGRFGQRGQPRPAGEAAHEVLQAGRAALVCRRVRPNHGRVRATEPLLLVWTPRRWTSCSCETSPSTSRRQTRDPVAREAASAAATCCWAHRRPP